MEQEHIKCDTSVPRSERVCSKLVDRTSSVYDTPYFEVIYSTRFGGFGFSDRFFDNYSKREYDGEDDAEVRTDSVAVQLLKDLGWKASSGAHARLRLCKVPQKYMAYYHISEYDGYETVEVDFAKYKLDRVFQINNDVDDSEERRKQIAAVQFEKEIIFSREDQKNGEVPEVGPLANHTV